MFRGGWGKNLVEAVFMSVYRRVAVNSIQKPTENGEVSQTLLARIVETRQDKTMLYLESYTVLCTSTLSK